MWSGGATANYVPVTVNFAGEGASNVTSVTFAGTYDLASSGATTTRTDNVAVTASGTTVQLVSGVEYTIAGTYSGGGFGSWSTVGGTLGNTSSASTTFTVTSASTLTLSATAAPAPGLCTDADHCMQISTATCGNNMVDSRTGVSYLTATINNQCYMEQNLYLPTNLTLTKDDTNITRDTWTTPTASLTAGNSYTEARMVAGTHTDNTYNATGGWYNYCAASAGTVCDSTTAQSANEDICPAGWRLPIMEEMTNVRDANRSNWRFYAGYYIDGSLQYTSSLSLWWSATASNARNQYSLRYGSGSLDRNSYYSKNYGFFVRCVRK